MFHVTVCSVSGMGGQVGHVGKNSRADAGVHSCSPQQWVCGSLRCVVIVWGRVGCPGMVPGSPGAAVSPRGRTRMEMRPQPHRMQAEGFGASDCSWEPLCIGSSRAVCVAHQERLAAPKREVGTEASCRCPGGALQPRPVQGLCWLRGCSGTE